MSISNNEISAFNKLVPDFSEHVIAFDVGSNKGLWADMLMAVKGNYEIHLFEPNPRMLSYLEIKYEYNERVRYVGAAAAAKNNTFCDFYRYHKHYNGLSALGKEEKWKDLPHDIIKVKTITLDQYCEDNAIPYIDILKIDVEGFEHDVLKGAATLLKERKIYNIQFEYSEHYSTSGKTGKDIIKLLNEHGYNVYSWDGSAFNLITADNFNEDGRLENLYAKPNLYTEKWNKDFIDNTIRLGKFDLVIEVGCFEGLTTNYICDNLLKEGGRIICIDPLEDEYLVAQVDDAAKEINKSLPQFNQQFERFSRNTRNRPVQLLRMPADLAFPPLQHLRADLIFIDGDHRTEAVYKDGCNAFKVCKVGGYILFDDYEWTIKGERVTAMGIDRFLAEHDGKYRMLKRESQVLIQKTLD